MRQRFSNFRMIRHHRSLVFTLSIGVAILSLPATSHAQPDLSLEPAVLSAGIDDALTIELKISGASNVYGWQVDVFFDPSVVSVLSTSEGTFLSNGGFTTFFLSGTLDNGAGKVDNMLATRLGAVPGVNDNGVLAELSFQAVGAGTSALTLGNVILADPSGQPLEVGTLSAASVQVAGGSTQSAVPALSLQGVGVFLLLLTGHFFLKRRRDGWGRN